MPLLKRLFSLHSAPRPLEDFFTEAVAALAEAEPGVIAGWLRSAGILDSQEPGPDLGTGALRAETQVRFRKLGGHDTDSYVDLVIHTIDDTDRVAHVVFIESKVGSTEITGQLRRYAQHLAGGYGDARRTLAYVTRDFDPKETEAVLGDVRGVVFRELRWDSLHRHLSDHLGSLPPPAGRSTLAHEIAHFMEAHRMDRPRRLDSADALAFGRIQHVIRFMREVLYEGHAAGSSPAPAAQFEELLGGRSSERKSLRQVPDRNRYVDFRTFGEDKFEVLLGFADQEEGYPDLFIAINARSHTESAEAIAEIARERRGGFRSGEPLRGWTSAVRSVPFEDIFPEEDHVVAARKEFYGFLDGLSSVMAAYPTKLPWEVPEAITEGDDG